MSQGRKTACRKGCCWNPLGVCGKSGNCACHTGYRERDEDRAAIIAEQARLTAARRLELPAWQRTTPAKIRGQ